MNKYYLSFGFMLIVAVSVILVACTSPGTGSSLFTSPITTPPASVTGVPPPVVSQKDVVLTIEVGNSVKLNEPIPVTLTVNSRVPLYGARSFFYRVGRVH